MKLKLHDNHGIELFDFYPSESSTHDWSLMSDNKISVDFERDSCVNLPAGCFVEFDGVKYYLLEEYKPTMLNSSAWKYSVTFRDATSWLSVTLALNVIDGQNTPLFRYTATASEHAAIIVANLNRRMGITQWKVGYVLSTENITIDYSGKYCSDVLQEIVDGQDTEWWIDEYTLNIGGAEFGDAFELGYQNGLLGDIKCDQADNMRLYAYLYPVGSTRNIDPTQYGYDRLQLPDGLTRITMNEQGVAELVEESAFAHIFPRYEGTVDSVRTSLVSDDGKQYKIYYISDQDIPFNPNDYEIAGLKKHITFLSGELTGAEFEVNYDSTAHEYEIITQWSDDGFQLPGDLLVPAVGDKYVVWNITMPQEYYPLASQEFLEAAQAFAVDAIQDVSIYKCQLDYIDVQERGLSVRPGQRVRLMSQEYFPNKGYYDSRITRITRPLWYPDEVRIDVSAVRQVGTLSKLVKDVKENSIKANQLASSYVSISASVVELKTLIDKFFAYDSENNAIKAKLPFYSLGGITAGGAGESNGGGDSYIRLDTWERYNDNKAGYVLSAGLGYDLHTRVSALEAGGSGEGSSTEVSYDTIISALGYTPYNAANFTKSKIKSTLGISNWALESTKPPYTASEVGALGASSQAVDSAKLGGQQPSYYATASALSALIKDFAVEQGHIDTLQSYFSNGSANNALKLGGQQPSYYASASTLTTLTNRFNELKALFDKFFEWDEEYDAIKAKISLYSLGGITAGGRSLAETTALEQRITDLETQLGLRISNLENQLEQLIPE